MNDFEKRINALRLEHKALRRQIQQDCDNLFTRINAALLAIADGDIRRILRAEKDRVHRQTHHDLLNEERCYKQQLAALNAEYAEHRRQNVSKREAARAVATLHRFAMQLGDDNKTIHLSSGEDIKAEITFD